MVHQQSHDFSTAFIMPTSYLAGAVMYYFINYRIRKGQSWSTSIRMSSYTIRRLSPACAKSLYLITSNFTKIGYRQYNASWTMTALMHQLGCLGAAKQFLPSTVRKALFLEQQVWTTTQESELSQKWISKYFGRGKLANQKSREFLQLCVLYN